MDLLGENHGTEIGAKSLGGTMPVGDDSAWVVSDVEAEIEGPVGPIGHASASGTHGHGRPEPSGFGPLHELHATVIDEVEVGHGESRY
jgi:hypothetical protein